MSISIASPTVRRRWLESYIEQLLLRDAALADGRILAFEIKANAAPRLSDAAHLTWLHGEIGDQFAGGVVFHTGPRPFRLADKIHALPIACLWGPLPETH